MEEFKSAEWSWKPFASDVEHQQSYFVNIEKKLENNPFDALQNNLYQINPIFFAHSLNENQHENNKNDDGKSSTLTAHEFIDPRNKNKITDLICCSEENVNLCERNDLLKRTVKPSKLSAETQLICLQYLTSNNKCNSNKTVYDETKEIRLTERCQYWAFVKCAMLRDSYRNEFIRPAIKKFIDQKMKREKLEIIENDNHDENKRYRLISAFNLDNPTTLPVGVTFMHHKRFGKLPKLKNEIQFVRQSTENMFNEYNRQKDNVKFFKSQITEIADKNQINVIIPLSVIRRFLKMSSSGYLIRVNVKETAYGKRVEIEKPLARQKAIDRRRKILIGSKYALRSCACSLFGSIFDCYTNDILTNTSNTDPIELSGTTNYYKLKKFEEIATKITKEVHRNISLNTLELNCCDNSLKILIPSKQDAFCERKNGEYEFINLSSKVESTAEYGAEYMSKNELIYEWCSLYFRPNTITKRYRHDLITGKIIKHESINQDNIEMNLKERYKIFPENLIQKLWTAITTIHNFPFGEYLLVNNLVQGAASKIMIYQMGSSFENAISINSFYENSSDPITESHWCQIDDTIVTDLHEINLMLPCAFPSSQYYETNQMRPLDFEIRPKSDSNRFTNRLQKRRDATRAIADQKKRQRNSRKRSKRTWKNQEKQVKKVAQETEKMELETIKSLFDEQPSTSSEPITTTRVLRKRTYSTTSAPPKTMNIDKAKEEIILRTLQTNAVVRTTRSGCISNATNKLSK